MDHLIIGTAGHVDHGKTVLIKALTGIDTDRLQEEKKRGISIDLGFAPFHLPSGRLAGVVDVPGHERFIHNMLAGASGMDLVMLVVDATEGVMPQTREHLDILGILGIKQGIVVITKIDLVEEEWRDLVGEEISEELKGTFLENAPVLSVSATKGQGIEELKTLIDEMTTGLPPRNSSGPLRLPIDRSFVIAGFGTVVTGTLIQGSVKVGDTVAIVPPGLEARVRNVQIHDQDVGFAAAGARVALNLSGLEKREVARGSVVSTPGYFRETDLVDVEIELLSRPGKNLRNLSPVHLFLGTARTVARLLLLDRDDLKAGEKALVQCRLENPLVAERGDPFVIRSYSPMTTIGGGKVLDPYPERHRRFRADVIKRLQELSQSAERGGDTAFLKGILKELVASDMGRIIKETRFAPSLAEKIMAELEEQGLVEKIGTSYILKETLELLQNLIVSELEKYHNSLPLSEGMSRASLKGIMPLQLQQRDYDSLLERCQQEGKVDLKNNLVALTGFSSHPGEKDQAFLNIMTEDYKSGGLQPPSVKEVVLNRRIPVGREDEFFGYLQRENLLVKVNEDLYYSREAYDKALKILKEHFKNEDKLTLAQFRDKTGTSRKFAQALLEHYDQLKYTRRVEDYRIVFRLKTS